MKARGPAGLEVPRAVVRHGDEILAEIAGLRIEPGRPVTVVGESGSGKSVLAHALMGTLPRELTAAGTMLIGTARFDLSDRASRRPLWGRELALLPQEPVLALDPTMRVRAQVAEGAALLHRRDRALVLADERLRRLGLGAAGAAYPHTLSGGMAQRVAYAAATIGGARILVVDEPSKGLDAASRDRLSSLLSAHAEEGGLLLTITHDLSLARSLGGDVLVMQRAAVVEEGPVAQVLSEPEHCYTRRLVAAEPSRWARPWMHPPAPVPSDEPLVSARGIAKAYGSTELFSDLSMEIRPGERWVVSGPSGSGKTSLGNVLLRLSTTDRGTVTHGAATRDGRIQKLYQDPALSFPPRVSLRAGLRDVLRRHRVQPQQLDARLRQVGLRAEILDRRPGQVSGGELQRVAIVRAMIPRPALVFADEPTSRLDLVTQALTMDNLMSEIDQTGCALVLVTHDDDLADAVGTRRHRLGDTDGITHAGQAAAR